jgi:membrane protease YdiL (CAAX protease family)
MEELLFRGYLLGVVTQWQDARRAGAADPLGATLDRRSVREIAPGAWSWAAVVLSSAAFALGHSPAQWLAAFAYGLLVAALWIARRDLVAPIAAHATTNLVLYLYIYLSGSWGLW